MSLMEEMRNEMIWLGFIVVLLLIVALNKTCVQDTVHSYETLGGYIYTVKMSLLERHCSIAVVSKCFRTWLIEIQQPDWLVTGV